ncbi:ABC transporter substrate-binding protein [Nocardia sp. NPDC058518]|uniref:ABC transporter substrate-binding protein n=1 Tax=Nocardia sp. NPDC058518 TaxID=3346534 RepID=UPI00364FE49D
MTGQFARTTRAARRRKLIAGALAGVLSVLLTACGQDDSAAIAAKTDSLTGPQKEWYEEAVEEPPMKYYSIHDPSRLEDTVKAFEDKYPGLEVEPLRLTSGSLMVRYSQERESNARTADMVTIADEKFVEDGLSKGWLAPTDKGNIPSLANLDDAWFNHGLAVAGILPLGIAYNTELVKNPPKDWTDVLDDSYRGKIAFPDFRASPVYAEQGKLWIDKYGTDFLRGLKDQEPILVDSIVPGAQMIATGQAEIMVPTVPSNIQQLKEAGAPVDMAYPENIVGTQLFTAIGTDSPAQNTAKLFLDFLFTEEGQEAFINTTGVSPIGSKGSIPLPTGFTRVGYGVVAETRKTMQAIFQLS